MVEMELLISGITPLFREITPKHRRRRIPPVFVVKACRYHGNFHSAIPTRNNPRTPRAHVSRPDWLHLLTRLTFAMRRSSPVIGRSERCSFPFG